LRNGDRVLFLGNTFIERDRYHGYLEAMLTSRFVGKSVIFRNMGWAGDTVSIQERPLNFGTLGDHIAGYKPTVTFVSYGANEAFDGEAAVPAFIDGYRKTLAMLEKIGSRVVMIGPLRHESLGAPLPDPAEHNRVLLKYVSALRELANEQKLPFIDLYHDLSPEWAYQPPNVPLTDNGMHLNAIGYRQAALLTDRLLGRPWHTWSVRLGRGEPVVHGAALSKTEASMNGAKFEAVSVMLPVPPGGTDILPVLHRLEADATKHPRDAGAPVGPHEFRKLFVEGLTPGRYVLKIDGQPVASGNEIDWVSGVQIESGPEFEQAERLRKLAVHKNGLYFLRWRAHNGEYIYGRRAKAQGGNAGNEQFPVEMARIEERIAEDEREISELARPTTHVYELVAEGEQK
jgi:lysophospholipase L1-like esterase